ncbi:hypothetical protein ACUXST_002046 [Sphingomonas sp. F9_3S_D5_B_2]
MNAALKATVAAVPERTIKVVCGSVAVGAAAIILLIVGLFRPSLGAVVSYGLIPLAIAVVAWGILAFIRLRLVGFMPSDARDADVIPRRLQPWIRGWLLVRWGLLGSGLLLVLVGVAAGIAQRDLLGVVIQAFVYLAWGRMLLDAVFGATFNASVISSRR